MNSAASETVLQTAIASETTMEIVGASAQRGPLCYPPAVETASGTFARRNDRTASIVAGRFASDRASTPSDSAFCASAWIRSAMLVGRELRR